MAELDELLQEDIIHAVRSDGTKMLAMRVQNSTEGPMWEVLTVEKDGHIAKDGTITLDANKQAIYRRTYTTEQLSQTARNGDYVEWQPGFLLQQENEQQATLKEQKDYNEQQLKQMEEQKRQIRELLEEQGRQIDAQLADAKTQLEAMVTTARRSIASRIGRLPRITPEEVEQQIKSTAAEIATRSPSHTQKIIANQVELSGGYYRQVAEQSQLSFNLSCWLVVTGAVLFVLTVGAVIAPFASGNTSLVGTLGTIATVIVESIAGFSFLYNRASKQLAEFQVYLDRIDRASICHAMIDDLDKRTEKQQELIEMIIQKLLEDK